VSRARIPASTYRLQLTPRFGFRDAARLVPYLAELGITDVYLSPIFAATIGSEHGYDTVDHNQLREELGGDEGFAELCGAARAEGLGMLLDFVPNHMGIGPANAWWMDVLENGPSSLHAAYFDVDWKPAKQALENKVLVPVLGDQYGAVLERGELRLLREGGTFLLAYFEHRFPIAPRQVPRLVGHRLPELTARLGESDPQLQELQSILTALEKLAPRSEVDPDKMAERAREKEVAKRRLAALFAASATIRDFIDENLRIFNGTAGQPRSFDLLDQLLDAQAYRLADWRVAGEEINYRRFFDINSLAAIRMEDERVFTEAHKLTFQLIAEGRITGLRIDHPDGLHSPSEYFRRLQQRAPRRPLYVIVEKILEGPEPMPESWDVDGTTGYEFLACVNGLFVDTGAKEGFESIYRRFIGEALDPVELIYRSKKLIMGSSMAGEIRMLSQRLDRISESNRRTRDFTLGQLESALVEYIACLPIYRTYVCAGGYDAPGGGAGAGALPVIDERDRRYVQATLARARRRSPAMNASVFHFLRDVLLLVDADDERREFMHKLQQVTGPVTAKAVEDTAFYVYLRLVSLNEVGGDPTLFGVAPAAFHELAKKRLHRWPGSLNTTSTHDTKRGEDTRLRIDALSEIPVEWERRLGRWRQLSTPLKTEVDGAPAPDANDELLLYQTLIGIWPEDDEAALPWTSFTDRSVKYMLKAVREAKVHTSWTAPDEAYEAATAKFVTELLGSKTFLDEMRPLARRVALAARLSSLSQVLLKVGAPGVADVYQGAELWDLSLVDPDNRRPVDFQRRRALLGELRRRLQDGDAARLQLAREVAAPSALADGRAKLLLLSESLRLRRARRALFLEGEYLPLAVEGEHAGHVVAFGRHLGVERVVCVAPRLWLSLLPQWNGGGPRWRGAVRLPDKLQGGYVDHVTGRTGTGGDRLPLSELLGDFPVALLRS
jgi:(1->4)-alpha-D-glucan 1-alpha-D-glucosylmutase